jgi:uncharacterized protein (DUF885 family)
MGNTIRVVLAVSALLAAARADEFEASYQAIVELREKEPEGKRLDSLFAVDWAYTMAAFPEFATYVGVPGHDTKWTDLSTASIAERKRRARRPLAVLATIDRARLSAAERVSYDLFKRQAEEGVEGQRFPVELIQLTQLGGIHQDAAQLFSVMPTSTTLQLENQVARLRALPAVVDQTIVLLTDGLRRGITPPQITLREVPQQVLNQIPEDALTSPLLRGFTKLPPPLSGEDGKQLTAEAVKIFAEKVRPAFQRLHAFLAEKYLPGARTSIAATALPDGAAWYAWRVKTETSTDLTPQQIHDLGLAEVKRIRAEMERVKEQAGFKGTMPEFFHHLRTDPKFYFTDKEELLRAYRDIAKRADPELMKLFRTLPRSSYGVKPIPSYAEKSQTTAYYYPGSPEAGRPGIFFANTYALHTRPKWEMESLTLHEAVPGHHLQLSLAAEMVGLPEFRKWTGYTAFVEGWGLYSESLGEEMGFYADPYAKFGQLTYEMWRAVRLVVDTGIHALGWSRERAIEFFKENASKTENDIVVEIDRYIVLPGQALAYKIGELKIKELRAFATKELGAKFDVRLFHDELLRNGAVPLSVLDAHIKEWVAGKKQG